MCFVMKCLIDGVLDAFLAPFEVGRPLDVSETGRMRHVLNEE